MKQRRRTCPDDLDRRRAEVIDVLAQAVLSLHGVFGAVEGAPSTGASHSLGCATGPLVAGPVGWQTPINSRIRVADAADATTIVRLLRGSGLTVAELEQEVVRTCLIAEPKGGGPIGAVTVEHHAAAAVFRGVFVAATCRLQGLGTRLAMEAFRRARSIGDRFAYTAALLPPWYLDTLGFELVARDLVPGAVLALPGICEPLGRCVFRLDLSVLTSARTRRAHAATRAQAAFDTGEPWWPDGAR